MAHVAIQDDRSPERGRRAFALSLVAILAIALLLRLSLGRYSLWFDEYASLIFSDQPQSRLWSLWMARETNPALFYSLLRGWRGLGADSVIAWRLLPILAGVAQIGVFAWICGRWHSRAAAVIVVLLLALSLQHILISQQLRGYAFAMLGASAGFAGLLLWWDGGRRRIPGMVLFVLGSLLACYTHTTMIVWVATGPAALVACHWRAFLIGGQRAGEAGRTRGALWRDLASMLAFAGLGSSWWIWVLLHRPAAAAANIGWIVRFDLFQTAFKFLQYAQLPAFMSTRELPLMLGGAALIVAMAWAGRSAGLVRLCCAVALLCPLAWWTCSLLQPMVTQRTVQWPIGFLAAILACGLAEVRPAPVRAAIVAALAGVLLINIAVHRHDFAIEDWDGAMAQAAARPSTALLVQDEGMAAIVTEACARRYQGPCPFAVIALRAGVPSDYWARGLSHMPLLNAAAARRQLGRFARVYAVRSGSYDPLASLDYPGRAPRIDAHTPFVEGPFPGASFAVRP